MDFSPDSWALVATDKIKKGMSTSTQEPDDRPAYERSTDAMRACSSILASNFAAQIVATTGPYLPRPLVECDVIDVGCGYGYTSSELATLSRSVLGVEPSATLAAHATAVAAKRNLPNLTIRYGALDSVPAEPAFDLAVLDNVFEHIPDQPAALRHLATILRPGGAAFILMPNKLWPIEVHYGLPLLSWLPLPLANLYLRASGRGTDYADASYAPTLWRLRALFADQPEFDWKLVLPADISLTQSGGSPLYRMGVAAIQRFPVLWAVSKALLVIATRRGDI
jgi:SAM-dependent methyltransferase